MPVELRQVERSLDETSDPLADAGRGNSVALGHRRDGFAATNLGYRPEDVLDVVRLARKQIARENTLARSAAGG